MADSFPIDLSKYHKLSIDPFSTASLSDADKTAIKENIQLSRDAIVFFTACGAANGYGGHTGGAFDTVPEVVLLDAFFQARWESLPLYSILKINKLIHVGSVIPRLTFI